MKKLLIFLLSFIPATAFGDIQEVIEGTYDEAVKRTSEQIETTARYWAEADLCDVSEDGLDGLFNFVGGVAAGTSVTAMAAGDSVLVVLTSSGALAISAPAVASTTTVAAGSVATGYVAIKAYCDNKDKPIYKEVVDRTTDLMCWLSGNC
jgi:hypothetical protein